ncbi:MAG TPA: hypothetical protein VI197_18415 [Polyangiaceae bacterium]
MTVTPNRSANRARAHAIFRLLVVLLALGLLLRASYQVSLATEQLFRVARGGVG